VLVNDGRPNGELLLSTGTLQEGNMSDCLYFPASLIAADRCGVAGAAGGSSCKGWSSPLKGMCLDPAAVAHVTPAVRRDCQ
jgi:hypothetical protein